MADLHRLAFVDERPWSAQEFREFKNNAFVRIFHAEHGYALARLIAGESELISIAVHPDHRQKGIARSLMRQWLDALEGAADIAFLEVAADNLPAFALYTGFGFEVTGKRLGYYTRRSGGTVDAFLMSCSLIPAKPDE